MTKLHLGATVLWALLLVPTLLWWRESILWVATMSLYANLVGHWSAYQAARAELHSGQSESQEPTNPLDALYSQIMGI